MPLRNESKLTAKDKIRELMRLHDEAFDAMMRVDGHCKSSEGYVELCLTNHTDRAAGVDPLEVQSVGVYSYVLGPSRMHHFDSVDEALETVRKWHREAFDWIKRECPEALVGDDHAA